MQKPNIKFNIQVARSIDPQTFQPVAEVRWAFALDVVQDVNTLVGRDEFAKLLGEQILDAVAKSRQQEEK